MVATARSLAALEPLQAAIQAVDGIPPPTLLVADLVKDGGAERLAADALAAAGRIDVLINNAGGSRPMPMPDDPAAWAESFQLNFIAARQLGELADAARTGAILTGMFGFEAAAQDGDTARFRVEGAALGGIIDLRTVGGFLPARLGRGSVHHLAFRATDDAAQAGMVTALARDHGIDTTEQKDRDYFRSVYFREPGSVLFEIATDIPGFAVDEDAASLGTELKLPRFLQPHRAEIEAVLPALA